MIATFFRSIDVTAYLTEFPNQLESEQRNRLTELDKVFADAELFLFLTVPGFAWSVRTPERQDVSDRTEKIWQYVRNGTGQPQSIVAEFVSFRNYSNQYKADFEKQKAGTK